MTVAELAELYRLPPTVSVEEAGALLGISRTSAYRAVARGEIPSLRLGRRLLVPSAKLLELLGLDSETDGPLGRAGRAPRHAGTPVAPPGGPGPGPDG